MTGKLCCFGALCPTWFGCLIIPPYVRPSRRLGTSASARRLTRSCRLGFASRRRRIVTPPGVRSSAMETATLPGVGPYVLRTGDIWCPRRLASLFNGCGSTNDFFARGRLRDALLSSAHGAHLKLRRPERSMFRPTPELVDDERHAFAQAADGYIDLFGDRGSRRHRSRRRTRDAIAAQRGDHPRLAGPRRPRHRRCGRAPPVRAVAPAAVRGPDGELGNALCRGPPVGSLAGRCASCTPT